MRRRSFRVATGSAPIPPKPVFSVLPSISPSSGTVGITAFTAANGTATLTQSYSRRWLLNGAAVSTAATYTPLLTGSLVLEVTATGPGGVTPQTSTAVTVYAVDVTPPTITSSASVSVAENAALTHTLTANETVTWGKVGGADQALFTLVGDSLTMTAKNFEAPADADSNNSYIVQVRATDTSGNTADQTITVTVTDAVDSGIDPTISAPTLTLATANLTYPPEFDIGLDDTAIVGDTIRLQWDNNADFSSITGDSTNVIDAGEATSNAATFTGLSSIASGTHRFRARVERGSAYSEWSNVVTQGPDDVAPALSALSSQMVSSSSGKALFTTDTGEGTARAVFTTTNVAPSQVTVDASSFTLAISSTGAKEITGTGLTASTLYYAWVQHADVAGNNSPITAAGSFTTAAVAPVTSYAAHAFDSVNHGYASKTVTFSGGSIGAAVSDRLVIACLATFDGGTNTPSGVTIGGVGATRIGTQQGHLSMWAAIIPTGTTADVAVTLLDNIGFAGCLLNTVRTFNATPASTSVSAWPGSASAPSASATIGTNQLGIAFAGKDATGATAAWSGATASLFKDNSVWSLGTAIVSATGTVTAGGFGGSQNGMIIGIFQP